MKATEFKTIAKDAASNQLAQAFAFESLDHATTKALVGSP